MNAPTTGGNVAPQQVTQQVTIQITGPGTEPRAGALMGFTPAVPRIVAHFQQELPNLWPDDVRESVLQFLA